MSTYPRRGSRQVSQHGPHHLLEGFGRRNGDRVRAGQRIEGEREIERPVHVEKDPAHLAAQRQAQRSQMLFATRMGNQIVTEMLAQPAQCMAHRRLAQPHPPPRLGQGRCVKNGVKGIEHIEVKPMNRRLCDARAIRPVTHRLLHSHHNRLLAYLLPIVRFMMTDRPPQAPVQPAFKTPPRSASIESPHDGNRLTRHSAKNLPSACRSMAVIGANHAQQINKRR
jgi:hypothetical protein